jgi:molybdopterin-guanine dinucleotide biosynthesis protein A
LSGLDAGLAAAIEVGADRVVLVGGDMPTLQPSLLSALLGLVAPEGVEGAAPVVDGVRRPLPCALRVAETAAALGQLATSPDRSLRALLARLRVVDLEEIEWRRLDPGGRSFVDVDRPGDLERATDAPPTSDPETR